jgi:hypothetical protein
MAGVGFTLVNGTAQILDKDKEVPRKALNFENYGISVTHPDEWKNIVAEIKQYRVSDDYKQKALETVCDSLKASTTTFIVMSDYINSETPAKGGEKPVDGFLPIARTADFVDFLVEKKCGIVVGSPIGRNLNHTTPTDYSVVQVWIWVPPHRTQDVIKETAFITDDSGAANLSQWLEGVRKHFAYWEPSLSSSAFSKMVGASKWNDDQLRNHLFRNRSFAHLREA